MFLQTIRPLFSGFLFCILVVACGGNDDSRTGLANPNVYLSELSVSGYEIDFRPEKTGPYIINVANSVVSIEVSAVPGRDGLEIHSNQAGTVQGRFDTGIMESGQSKQFELAEGKNVFSIIAREWVNGSRVDTEYLLSVNRVSTSAALIGLSPVLLSGEALAAITLEPAFEPGIFRYTASVPYDSCAIGHAVRSDHVGTRVALTEPGGEKAGIKSNVPYQTNLAVGENTFVYELVSEDGLTTVNYEMQITRAAPSDDVTAAMPTLLSLTDSTGNLGFKCFTEDYLLPVNNSVNSVDFIATPESAEATITLNGMPYLAGEIYTVDVTEGLQTLTFEVTSADGENTISYEVNVARLLRNRVEVRNAEELQAALLNAQPNEEIRLLPGDYVGVVGASTSGSDQAHFYSSQSGTQGSPIYLTAASPTELTRIAGSELGQYSALLLSGDYWHISGIAFSGAKNALVLDAANHNVIKNVMVTHVGGQGILLRNGSADNEITESEFFTTGQSPAEAALGQAQAIVVGSDDSLWLDQPAGSDSGLYAPGDNNNAIRANVFATSVIGEALEINEGAVGTRVEFNVFAGNDSGSAGDSDSIIHIQGNESLVSYNTFDISNPGNLQSVIQLSQASENWHTESWGENAQVFQNIFDLGGADIPLVNATDVSLVDLTENRRVDEGNGVYLGSGIREDAMTVPVYQLQLVENPALCMTPEDNLMVTGNCSEEDQSQQWKLLNDGGTFLTIQNQSDTTKYLAASPAGDCLANVGANIFLADLIDGFVFRWFLDFERGNIQLKTKANTRYSASADIEAGSVIVMCPEEIPLPQEFQLVEIP